ncbi:MAG TPA: FKBP-type peptidyl-prolyl cis-trans isomerase [Steroidobacteraceae bacterium]|jgi:FKBP-type peptidyl-prolyl cis-trans isomerase FkpA/FKBP-type peptidyl-prolyl cis-trans isomerase FklB
MSKLTRAWPSMAAVLGALAALVAAQSSVAASAPKSSAATAAPNTASMSDDDKTLYALGVLISRNLETFQLSSSEFKTVEAGLADGYNHHANLDLEQYDTKVQALQRTRVAAIDEHQKQAGQAYIDKAAALPGAQKTATGMVFIPVSEGKGVTPARSDRVLVNYEGRLIDGTVFDSSAKHGGQPASLSVTGVIPCWTEALMLMKVGGKSRVVCPSSLAYGDRGMMPVIMPGATLDFSIELVDLASKQAAPATGAMPPTQPGDHN